MIVITQDQKICEALASRKVTVVPAFTSWNEEPFLDGSHVYVLGLSLAVTIKKGIKKGKSKVAKHTVFVMGEPGQDFTKTELSQLIEAVEEAEGLHAPKWPFIVVESPEQLDEFVACAQSSKGMALDIETNYDKKIGDATSYPFSHPSPQILTVQCHFWPSDQTYVLPMFHAERDPSLDDEQRMTALKTVLSGEYEFIVGQNFNFDRMWLWDQCGIRVKSTDDTLLLNQLASHASEANDLKTMAKKHLDVSYKNMVENWLTDNRKYNYADVPLSIMAPYGAWDTKATAEIRQKHLETLQQDASVLALYQKVIMPITDVVLDMTCNGLPVDTSFLIYLERHFAMKAGWYMEMILKVLKLRGFVEENFNPRSPKQMQELLYTKLHLLTAPTKGPFKGKKTVNAVHLLTAVHNDCLIPLFNLHNKYAKLGSQIQGYKKLLSRSINSQCPVYLHPTFNVGGTDTGRMSSSQPNGQNIDKHSGLRRMFVPSPVAEAKQAMLDCIKQYRKAS